MNSIKHQVLSEIAKRKQCNRQDVQKFIWVAQGNDIKDYVNRQGYYGTNIVEWKYSGLIDNNTKNVFKITKKGREYIKNPNLYNKMARNEKKVALYNGMEKRYNEVWNENQELRRKVWELNHTIQNLTKKDTLQDAIDYFEMTDGNYSGDTKHYINVLINHLNK
mgnify:CR=1 FL=1|tara:strand:- start:1199 stop:1690 length:492 start_codon:yes stop_codon:yes gene_type:complete